MFFPVLALMRWLNILSSWGIKDGKIFIDDECKSSREYRESLRNWFKNVRLKFQSYICAPHTQFGVQQLNGLLDVDMT